MPDLVRKNAARSQRHFCRTDVGGVCVNLAISDGFFMQRFVDCGAVWLRFTGRQEALRYEKARIIGTRTLQANSALRKVRAVQPVGPRIAPESTQSALQTVQDQQQHLAL